MGYQKIKAFGWIVFEIIDRLAGSETSLDPNRYHVTLELDLYFRILYNDALIFFYSDLFVYIICSYSI